MFLPPALTAAAQALADLVTHLSLHDGGDVSSSTDESTVARAAITWDNVDGTLTGHATFEGGTPGDVPPRLGYWDAATGGTYRGGRFRTSLAAFSSTGHLEVTVIETSYSV